MKDKIKIAKVLRPVGLKGEIKCKPYIDFNFFSDLNNIYIEGVKYTLLRSRTYKNFVYILLKEVRDISRASSLRNKDVSIYRLDLHLKSGEYLPSDLEGCKVITEDGKLVGFVENIDNYGATDIVNVMSRGEEKSFPLLKEIVKMVDTKNKVITVYKDKLSEVLI